MQHFNWLSLIPFLTPLLIIIVIVASVIRSEKNTSAEMIPPMQIWAQLIRIEPVDGTLCRVTFEDAACKRFTLDMPVSGCDALKEGSTGSLCYQGTVFISFSAFS